jgi:SAM-dependent methyltransferase
VSDLPQTVSEGHYARKQIFSRDWLIAWSHRSRFDVGLRVARRLAARRVLDYGCGDGSFLAMLMDGEAAPREAVGAELSDGLVEDCRRRHGAREGLHFICVEELSACEHEGAYDLVVCMEVLEHVIEVEPLLEHLARLVAPGGRLVVSVPVETGLPLLVKQFERRVAGWRGIGDYPGTSPYTARELCAATFTGRRQHIERPVHTNADGSRFHDHKGFNWMRMRETLARRFNIETTLASPLTWLPPHLASQAWFVLREV